MDLWYIDHWSLWLDAKIVFMTFGELFRAEPEPIEDELNIERARAATQTSREGGSRGRVGCAPRAASPFLTRTCCAPTSRRAACSIPASRSCSTRREGSGVVMRLHRARDPRHRCPRRDDALRLRRAASARPPTSTRRTSDGARGRGVVSTFVRFHPLFENHRGCAVQRRYASPTVGWRLDRRPVRGHARQAPQRVRKAQRAGVAVRRDRRARRPVRVRGALRADHAATAGATDYYFFPPAYWERLDGAR